MHQMIPDFILKDVLELTEDLLVVKALRRTLEVSKQLRKRKAKAFIDHPAEKYREVYDMEGKEDPLPGTKVLSEDAPPEEHSDEVATYAFENAGVAYDYYLSKHGRYSLDGHGMKIISSIHYGPKHGQGIDNAFWNGRQIVYGDGTVFQPLAKSLVVAGHEFTHALTSLKYVWQSGGINEHISDVHGINISHYAYNKTIKDGSFLIGEDIVTDKFPGRALRDMGPDKAYSSDRQVKHTKDLNKLFLDPVFWQDNMGVHLISGIPNYAYFKLCHKLYDRGIEEFTFGIPAKVWYKAALACGSLETFASFKKITMQAAEDFGPNVVSAIEESWQEVGV